MAVTRHPDSRCEIYISVDVETSGPNPSDYDLLSIGACLVHDLDEGFYVELQPVTGRSVPEALAISGLSMAALAESGVPPLQAMAAFEAWVNEVTPAPCHPIFVALNAPFDWMFVNDYFHRYLGRDPFGHSALDVKAFYMGMTGVPWAQTSMEVLSSRYLGGRELAHNALQDARDQGELFAALLQRARSRR